MGQTTKQPGVVVTPGGLEGVARDRQASARLMRMSFCLLYCVVELVRLFLVVELDGIEGLFSGGVDAFDEHHFVVVAFHYRGVEFFDVFG
jgi:hypothetical protein